MLLLLNINALYCKIILRLDLFSRKIGSLSDLRIVLVLKWALSL
jgi:hypothetical protein